MLSGTRPAWAWPAIALLLVAGAHPAGAFDVPTVEDLKPGFDLKKYRFSYPLEEMKFAARTFKMCWWGCHEAAQLNHPGTILPRIEGQAVEYFLNQWNAFDGDRKGSIASQMKLMMHSYTPDQMRAVAEVAQVFEIPYEPSPAVLASEAYKKGEKVYGRYCAMCRGPRGDSRNPKYPVLRGQTSGYIYEQMINFRDETRISHDSAMMTPFARILDEEVHRNLATYLSGTEWFEREEDPQFITGVGMPPVEGFRLPNVKEGVSLVDYNRFAPSIDEAFFPNTPSERFFWLSTSDALKNAQEQPDIFFNPFPPAAPPRKSERLAAGDVVDHGNNIAWAMEFTVGSAWRYTKDREFYVRCTRYATGAAGRIVAID